MYLVYIKYGAHKEQRVGLGWYYEYYCIQRSSAAQTIRPIIKVNSFISGPFSDIDFSSYLCEISNQMSTS